MHLLLSQNHQTVEDDRKGLILQLVPSALSPLLVFLSFFLSFSSLFCSLTKIEARVKVAVIFFFPSPLSYNCNFFVVCERSGCGRGRKGESATLSFLREKSGKGGGREEKSEKGRKRGEGSKATWGCMRVMNGNKGWGGRKRKENERKNSQVKFAEEWDQGRKYLVEEHSKFCVLTACSIFHHSW